MPIYKPGSTEATSFITKKWNVTNLSSPVDLVDHAVLWVKSPTGETIYPWNGITAEGSGSPLVRDEWNMGWTGNDYGNADKDLDIRFIRHDLHLSNVTEQYVGMFDLVCAGHIYGVTPGRRIFMAVAFTAVGCTPTFGVAFYRHGFDYRIDEYGNQIKQGEFYYSGQGVSTIPTVATGTDGSLAKGYVTIPGYPYNNETFWGPVLKVPDAISGWQVYIHKLIGTMV